MTARSHNAVLLKEARYYASLGWYSIHCNGVKEDGTCTCHKGKECNSVGKHPVPRAWQKVATNNEDKLLEMFAGSSYKNLGVVLGPSSGIVDIEWDTEEGRVKLLSLCEGEMPQTPCFSSGKGVHYIFKYNSRLPKKAHSGVLLKGCDVKIGYGGGTQSIFPPSRHYSNPDGYHWLVHPNECEVAEIPEGLLSYLEKGGDRAMEAMTSNRLVFQDEDTKGKGKAGLAEVFDTDERKEREAKKQEKEHKEIAEGKAPITEKMNTNLLSGTVEGGRHDKMIAIIGKKLSQVKQSVLESDRSSDFIWKEVVTFNQYICDPPMSRSQLSQIYGDIKNREVVKRRKEMLAELYAEEEKAKAKEQGSGKGEIGSDKDGSRGEGAGGEGVGGEGGEGGGECTGDIESEISGAIKLVQKNYSNESIFELHANGLPDGKMEVTVDQLTNWRKLSTKCMTVCGLRMPSSTRKGWYATFEALHETREIVDASKEELYENDINLVICSRFWEYVSYENLLVDIKTTLTASVDRTKVDQIQSWVRYKYTGDSDEYEPSKKKLVGFGFKPHLCVQWMKRYIQEELTPKALLKSLRLYGIHPNRARTGKIGNYYTISIEDACNLIQSVSPLPLEYDRCYGIVCEVAQTIVDYVEELKSNKAGLENAKQTAGVADMMIMVSKK